MADVITRLKVESNEYDSKIKRAAQGLQHMEDACRKVGGTLAHLEKDQLEFVRGLGKMETVSKTARGRLGELTTAFTDLRAQYSRLTQEEKNGDYGRALNQSLGQLKVRIQDAKKELNDINKELQGGNGKFGQFGSIIDGIGQKMGINTNITELLTSRTALLTGAIGASVAVVGKAADEWAKYNAELAKQDQITTVTTGLKGDEANRMTDQARAIVDTYNVDFRETINAANTLMTQFGKTGEEAMALISNGMRGMIQGDGGKLLSMIQQYAPSFRDAGIAADQLVAIIHNSEGGLFTDQNMNAIVMGIKNIRLMTKSTSEALAKLGIDGQEMTRKLNDGSMTIFEAMQKVSNAINQTGSASQAAGEVMQAVFGRQGAAAGTRLGEAIATLNTNLDETKKKTGELGESFNDLYKANIRLNTAIRDAFGYDGWEQMAIGIKSKLIGALSDVIEHLVIIEEGFGKIKNFFGGGGGNKGGGIGYSDVEKVQQWINNGKDDDERRRRYDKAIADLQKKLNNVGKEYSVKNPDGSTSFKIDDAETQARKREALEKRMSMLYATKYTPKPEVIKPIVPEPKNPKGGSKTIKTEEQLNNEQINKLTQEYIKASDDRRKAIEEEIRGLQKRNEEIQKLKDVALGKIKTDGSLPALTRQLQDLQKQQSQAANGAEWDNYQKKIVETTDKINVLKGVLPKGQQSTFTLKGLDDVLAKAKEVNGVTIDDKTMTVIANTQEAVDALKTIQGLQIEPKTAVFKADYSELFEQIRFIDDVKVDDKTLTITAYTAEAMRQVRDMVGDIEGMDVVIEPKVEIQEPDLRTPFQRLQDSIRLELSAKNVDVDKNTLKSLTEVVTKYDIQTGAIDISKVMAQTEELTKGGMEAGAAYSKALQDAMVANLDLSTIQQRIGEEIDIPDETWQKLQDEINAKLAELGIKPIQIDFSTGNVKKQSKEMAKDWEYAAQAVRSVGSAMSAIEDPSAKIIGTIGEAIANIALGFAMATAKDTKLGVWGWIAAVAGGLATMVSTISAIHSATGYAQGGMIEGNSYSGDNIGGLVDGSQLVGLNAGEVVLNASQQQNLASNLQNNGGQTVHVVGKIRGTDILLSADRTLKLQGKQLAIWNG